MHKISVDTKLPPLPESFCYKHDGTCWPDTFSAGQMKAYARAAIERQSVPDLNRLAPFVGGLGKAILQELIEDMAAAPQPQKKCWCAACDMAKNVIQTGMALCPECGDKRCPKAMRHDAACSAAPLLQQEPVAAQHRFRHPQKTMPDWSPWQPCKVANRPAWQIDSQGYEVEYRALYTSPQEQGEKQ